VDAVEPAPRKAGRRFSRRRGGDRHWATKARRLAERDAKLKLAAAAKAAAATAAAASSSSSSSSEPPPPAPPPRLPFDEMLARALGYGSARVAARAVLAARRAGKKGGA
jgi:hypothetical protein